MSFLIRSSLGSDTSAKRNKFSISIINDKRRNTFTLKTEKNIAHAFHLSLFIPSENCNESSNLEDIIEKDGDCCLTTECLKRWNICESSNQECKNLWDCSCRNGRTNFCHTASDSRMEIFTNTSLYSSTNNEHIIHTNSQDQERNNFCLFDIKTRNDF